MKTERVHVCVLKTSFVAGIRGLSQSLLTQACTCPRNLILLGLHSEDHFLLLSSYSLVSFFDLTVSLNLKT